MVKRRQKTTRRRERTTQKIKEGKEKQKQKTRRTYYPRDKRIPTTKFTTKYAK
jgi:hypothetical protein